MAEYTLLKLQCDDASFIANAPFSGSDGDATDEDVREADEDDAGGNRRLLPLLVGFAFLFALAVVVYRRRGGSGDD